MGQKFLSDAYINGISRSYGTDSITTGDSRNLKFQGGHKIEDIKVGDKFLNMYSEQVSTVTGLTSSSIEMLNMADTRNLKGMRKKVINNWGDEEDKGKVRGIDSKQWYVLDNFNMIFKRISEA